jgi:hypothetical protein
MIKRVIFWVVAVFFAGLTSAGEFFTANYGNTKVKDFQDLVTPDFTARFPADSWDLFIYSEAFTMSRSGQAICNAIVGVVPKGGHQFPRRQFKMTKTATVKPGRWNEAEALDFETECVRAAIDNMMTTDLAKVYRAHSN